MKRSLGIERIRHLVEVLGSGSYPLFTSDDKEFFKNLKAMPTSEAKAEFRRRLRAARCRARALAECLALAI